MKFLPLTNSSVPVLVDDDDYEDLIQFKWRLLPGKGYVARSVWRDGRSQLEYLHRRIMNAPKGMDVDHIDMNPFNNQKSNLRIVTRSQNMLNTRARPGHSKYKGVSLYNRPNMRKPWVAYIRQNYKTIALGYFETEVEAARAYNVKAFELYGDIAILNDVPKDEDETNQTA